MVTFCASVLVTPATIMSKSSIHLLLLLECKVNIFFMLKIYYSSILIIFFFSAP